MPKRILRPLLAATVLLMSAACSSLTPPGESVAQVTFNGAPQIEIVSPQANSRYMLDTDVYILARVENAGPDIGSMVVRIGDTIVAQTDPDTGDSGTFTIKAPWTASRLGLQTISVSVQRADPSLSDMKTVDIEVMGAPTTPTVAPTEVLPPTIDPAPAQPTTDTSSPTVNTQPTADTSAPQTSPTTASVPPTSAATTVPPTASVPQVRVKEGANVRRGPATTFDPPLGSMAAGQTAEILGKNLDGTWYKIRIYNSEGWIAALTVTVEGNVSNIPAEAGPPTPVPATPVPTVIAVTSAPTVPATGPDLVIEGTPSINPHPFVCNQASEITVTIKNVGSGPSNISKVLLEDLFNGVPGATTSYGLGALQPGQTAQAIMYLTVATNFNEGHTTRITVDADAQNTETNEGNNQYVSGVYSLAQGGC